MPALDNQDLARPNPPPAGAVAVANEEAVRAWDTVLYERWKSNRKVFVGALSEVTEDVFDLYPPPEQRVNLPQTIPASLELIGQIGRSNVGLAPENDGSANHQAARIVFEVGAERHQEATGY